MVITPNEPLELLNSGGYIEDYFGAESELTLHNTETNVRYDILFTDTNANSLSGYIPLNTIPDGTYSLEGRISDTIGNNLIIGQIQNPGITGTVITVLLSIKPAIGLGATLSTQFQTQGINFRLAIIENGLNINTQMTSSLYFNVRLLKDIPPIF